jgi:hypothetical protein
MFIYFLIINTVFQITLLYYNIFNIKKIFNISFLLFNTIYSNIFKNKIENKENNGEIFVENKENEKDIIVKKFIKNINIELKPILLILQYLNEKEQFNKLVELEKKYPHISYIFPLKQGENVSEIINKYLSYCNQIYNEKN